MTLRNKIIFDGLQLAWQEDCFCLPPTSLQKSLLKNHNMEAENNASRQEEALQSSAQISNRSLLRHQLPGTPPAQGQLLPFHSSSSYCIIALLYSGLMSELWKNVDEQSRPFLGTTDKPLGPSQTQYYSASYIAKSRVSIQVSLSNISASIFLASQKSNFPTGSILLGIIN